MRFWLALLVAGCTVNGGPIDCPSKQRAPARSGAEAVLVPATNQIYVGGNDYWRWSFGACGGWLPLHPSSLPPADSYTPALDDKRDRIVYIGKQVWALDTNKLTFNKLVTVGSLVRYSALPLPVPSARSSWNAGERNVRRPATSWCWTSVKNFVASAS